MPIDMPIGCQATITRETARICFEAAIAYKQNEKTGTHMNTINHGTTRKKKLNTSKIYAENSRTKTLQVFLQKTTIGSIIYLKE